MEEEEEEEEEEGGQADQQDRVLSTSEDSLFPPPPPPSTRVRPLSDVYPFQSSADRTTAQVLLSGCGSVQVQPVTLGPHGESRLNGINSSSSSSSSAWSGPGKPYSTRIMRLFSTPRKCPGPGLGQTVDGPAPGPGGGVSAGGQAWAALPGLAVIDSFKKLRSSVLQGIQSRGTANQDGEFSSLTNHGATTNGGSVSGRGLDDADSRLKCDEGPGVSNGKLVDQYGFEDEFDDAEEEELSGGGGHVRNTRLSRSIRRAYGAGRISILDTGQERPGRNGTARSAMADSQKPFQGSGSDIRLHAAFPETCVHADAKVLTRLSRSAENLNLFRRKAPSPSPGPGPPPPQPDSPGSRRPSETPSIQRTASVSSVDVRGRSAQRWMSPVRTKENMRKLVGSMTDLTTRRRTSPSPGPSPVPSCSSTPRSRIHDDYSRRTPCLPAAERQRRPSPARARPGAPRGERAAAPAAAVVVVTLEYAPEIHAPPRSESVSPVEHRILIGPVPASPDGASVTSEPAGRTSPCVSVESEPLSAACGTGATSGPAGISPQLRHREALGSPGDHEPLEHERDQSPASVADGAPEAAGVDTYTGPAAEHRDRGHTGLLHAHHTEDPSADHQVRGLLLRQQEASPTASGGGGSSSSISQPSSPADLSESPTSLVGDTSADSTTTPNPVHPRRRATRPRPISDYGQLVSRRYPIPEEGAELSPSNWSREGPRRQYSADGCGYEGAGSPDCSSPKQRPVSVIGMVEGLPSPDEKEARLPSPLAPAHRPPRPSHDVPPYRAVSARFRPSSALSQSTPIGLDRLGRHRLHRVLSDGMSECSAALDGSVSEEDGSFDELSEATPYLQPGVEPSLLNQWISGGHAVYAEALWDHVTMGEQELAFKVGDVIRVRVNQEDFSAGSAESVLDPDQDQDQGGPAQPRDPHSSQHRDQMRTNVVQEIMTTERIYIKHLRDICEGYIRQCRKHPTMFTEPQLHTIFSNIEDIYRFQRQFLRELESKDGTWVGFGGGEGFSIYSEYCNSHPTASGELHRLMKLGRYKHFFEACRLLQKMINISIAGFLLTPVQKICKYPLQLGELLKYTPKDHSDYSGVSRAYEAMKNVASLINERKRRLETLDAIAQWQVAILNWEGRAQQQQQRFFFLFDHQLVFCKKDVLRRDLLHYRGRLDMDRTRVQELPDGRDLGLGLTLRNALRLRDADTLEALCVLCCRKPQDRQRWLDAFTRERRRVQEDQEMGMEITDEQRKRAIFNARKVKQGKIKAIGYSGSVPPHHQNLHQNLHPLHQRHVTVPTSVPQQPVFTLAEPPKRKPAHLWYSITRSAFFKK
ncbi:hypothetical protein CRUP_011056 [Coryphaenoides rupestris]|nr:hypothetical protein CRUP_011056 [Coryphaenoides rupestris]